MTGLSHFASPKHGTHRSCYRRTYHTSGFAFQALAVGTDILASIYIRYGREIPDSIKTTGKFRCAAPGINRMLLPMSTAADTTDCSVDLIGMRQIISGPP